MKALRAVSGLFRTGSQVPISTSSKDIRNDVSILLKAATDPSSLGPWEDDKPIVDWHTDSYPFVCVTMLSECRDMVGGETALRTGSGDIWKVRGPSQGCAVVLQ